MLVVDASRMLPGAVLARSLLDLGARLVKLEHPRGGDPMRSAPPVDEEGTSLGWAAFHRGAESVCCDLRTEDGQRRALELIAAADVFVESFRAGTLERWGFAPRRLRAETPRLISCSLSAYGAVVPDQVGHDLNFVAASGLLSLLGTPEVPQVQIADVTAGLLAASSILAALLARERGGKGTHLEQPLATGVLPFLTWHLADLGRDEPGTLKPGLSGDLPIYRIYTCADGERLALATFEPKFWLSILTALRLPQLVRCGLDPGEKGRRATERIQERLASKPRAHWLEIARKKGLPLSPVDSLQAAVERGTLTPQAPYFPSLGAPPRGGRAPRLGEHDEAPPRA
ncbi:MAG: hypothetical protein CMJ84_16025 [Planctomycetes bacterium]|nr:hypothetical protein [Planctomycetota bacterium]